MQGLADDPDEEIDNDNGRQAGISGWSALSEVDKGARRSLLETVSAGGRLPRDREMLWGRRRDFLPGSQEVKWRDGNPSTNAWLPGFITAYNTRFGRNPANAKRACPWLEQGTCIGR
jgi:hypothetical protein